MFKNLTFISKRLHWSGAIQQVWTKPRGRLQRPKPNINIPLNNGMGSSAEHFKHISGLSDVEHLHTAAKHIMVPRVVGTPGHAKVRQYIVQSLQQLEWSVQLDNFTDTTPIFGKLEFSNIIATLNPRAKRYLVLSAHYDSKYFADMDFVGATDSAVPCAMLLNLAHVLNAQLAKLRSADLSLMLIFFDGEEAFQNWSASDSIYGARHLAAKWKRQDLLKRIELFVLLDLLGSPDPKFVSFFEQTERDYVRLYALEQRLTQEQRLVKHATGGTLSRAQSDAYFTPYSSRSQIDDDHMPFLQENVPVLHLIPPQFPDFWHTVGDNASVIDWRTTENLSLILRLFTLDYFILNNALEASIK